MTKRVAVTFGNVDRLPAYESALAAVGIEPVRNPNSLTGLEGLLLTGGTDVNPEMYGEEPSPETQQPDRSRDELESRLLVEALDLDRPILAICRGLQLFNVVHGGSLQQHIANTREHVVRTPPNATAHVVGVDPNTRLAAAIGAGVKAVNSRHHQAVGRIGDHLVCSATAHDGLVEGLERPDKRFALAVQWHPEDRIREDSADLALFQAFAAALKE